MPKYFYECKGCQSVTEVSMSVKNFLSKNASQVQCESCDSLDVTRIFTEFSNKIDRSKEEILEKAKEDAKDVVKRIRAGDVRAIRNIYGEN